VRWSMQQALIRVTHIGCRIFVRIKADNHVNRPQQASPLPVCWCLAVMQQHALLVVALDQQLTSQTL
jgi:hypothetical protein